MLKESLLKLLRHKKNLLAFSGGGDSTALFYLLLENNIPFDIAIVNYNLRDQSKLEVTKAQTLASQHKRLCHVYQADKITHNFEKNARLARYGFFDTLIQEHNYNNLLTAHHLGDKLEWLLMQLSKGAGLVELLGMQELEERENYYLIRPLLGETKESLLNYLRTNNIAWFEDESNQDQTIKRNFFRHKLSNLLLQEHASGIKKSFKYLTQDLNDLRIETSFVQLDDLSYALNTQHDRSNEIAIDQEIKQRGYILSAAQREEFKKTQELIVARQLLVTQSKKYLFILPFINHQNMDKKFKERCRKLNVPIKMRPYLFKNQHLMEKIESLFI